MPKFYNSYLIKGAIRQASFEAQKLHLFYYKLYYILFTLIPVHNKACGSKHC